MATPTPPGALNQSISLEYTKEELKDLVLEPNNLCARVKEGLHVRAPRTGVGRVLTPSPQAEKNLGTCKISRD
jgi:hypothetical protein